MISFGLCTQGFFIVVYVGWPLRQESGAECMQQHPSLRLSISHSGAARSGVGVGRLQPSSLH